MTTYETAASNGGRFVFKSCPPKKRRAATEASAAAFCEIRMLEKTSSEQAPNLFHRHCVLFPTKPFPATATDPLQKLSVCRVAFSRGFLGRFTKSGLLRSSHCLLSLLHSARNARARHRASRFDAGWSSPVARQAHNLKVVGSNPTPATKF